MNISLLIAGILGLSSVLLGAFSGHGLQLSLHDQKSWDVALNYHQLYSIVVLAFALFNTFSVAQLSRKSLHGIITGFTLGIILFSGSIYIRILTGHTGLNFLTPIGGGMLIISWAAVIIYSILAARLERRAR